ncbi:MAG TPA: glycosyltransferase family 39 protein [Vicinamibacterales bacterium]|nr:glycosyltransferase family 39 protein [Vicinamibacterales bacterium]
MAQSGPGERDGRALLEAVSPRRGWIWLALLVTVYGGLLRYEALVTNYGWMGQPAWSSALSRVAIPTARALRPGTVHWGPSKDPYVNGDPINYLRFAREMTHFYQAHVREPVFLALSRAWLWLCGNRDIGLSFASASGSTAAVFATYLLGAVAVSPLVGLLASLGLAVEFAVITASYQGWRDDTFMAVVALAAAGLVALRRCASPRVAVLAGVAMGVACLTRITSLSFVVPGLLWIAMETARPSARPAAPRHVAIAALIAAALVAPYLVNCARATGDPLISINYHTRYYRAAEGRDPGQSESAVGYIADKFASRPIAALDTGLQGVLTFPFFNKWYGYVQWHPRLPALMQWAAALGLLCAVFTPTGRFLLLLLFTSLVPYAMTWRVGGGGEWRFTQHAYPFYLVFAFWTATTIVRWLVARVRLRSVRLEHPRLRLFQAAMAVAMVAVALSWEQGVPLWAADEALRANDAVTLPAGHRDRWLFEDGWSEPIVHGVPYRVARAPVASLRLPVGGHSDFWLTLRLDPAETADLDRQPGVSVYLDRRLIARLRLSRDPQRVGTYRLRVTGHPERTFSRLELVASHLVPAREAGPHFDSLDPAAPVAFRLWYVRVDPDLAP